MKDSCFITMETFVIITTALLSFGALILQDRSRAFFMLFLHLLLALTVFSLTYRTLSGTGTLLVPFVDGWHRSPLMQLTDVRVYMMLAVSLTLVATVTTVKARIMWTVRQTTSGRQAFIESPYSCLMMIWIHITAIVSLLLL